MTYSTDAINGICDHFDLPGTVFMVGVAVHSHAKITLEEWRRIKGPLNAVGVQRQAYLLPDNLAEDIAGIVHMNPPFLIQMKVGSVPICRYISQIAQQGARLELEQCEELVRIVTSLPPSALKQDADGGYSDAQDKSHRARDQQDPSEGLTAAEKREQYQRNVTDGSLDVAERDSAEETFGED